jgi:hypothetical protein
MKDEQDPPSGSESITDDISEEECDDQSQDQVKINLEQVLFCKELLQIRKFRQVQSKIRILMKRTTRALINLAPQQ